MALHVTVAIISSSWPISFHLGSLLCVKWEWRIWQLPGHASPEKSALAAAFWVLAWPAWPLVSAAADAPSFPPIASPACAAAAAAKSQADFSHCAKETSEGKVCHSPLRDPHGLHDPSGTSDGVAGSARRHPATYCQGERDAFAILASGPAGGHGVHAHFLAQGGNMGVEGMGGFKTRYSRVVRLGSDFWGREYHEVSPTPIFGGMSLIYCLHLPVLAVYFFYPVDHEFHATIAKVEEINSTCSSTLVLFSLARST